MSTGTQIRIHFAFRPHLGAGPPRAAFAGPLLGRAHRPGRHRPAGGRSTTGWSCRWPCGWRRWGRSPSARSRWPWPWRGSRSAAGGGRRRRRPSSRSSRSSASGFAPRCNTASWPRPDRRSGRRHHARRRPWRPTPSQLAQPLPLDAVIPWKSLALASLLAAVVGLGLAGASAFDWEWRAAAQRAFRRRALHEDHRRAGQRLGEGRESLLIEVGSRGPQRQSTAVLVAPHRRGRTPSGKKETLPIDDAEKTGEQQWR